MRALHLVAALQARLWGFLEHQDEQVLLALVDGRARLSVVRGDDTSPESVPPTTSSRTSTPFSNPLDVARELSKITTAEERRTFLISAGLTVTSLRQVAKFAGRRRYSKLGQTDLIALLAGDSPGPMSPHAPSSAAETASAPPGGKATAVAAHLRQTETEEEGEAYLREQHLSKDELLAVAAELQLTRVSRLSHQELVRRVLKQAIGARRKFAGLRKW